MRATLIVVTALCMSACGHRAATELPTVNAGVGARDDDRSVSEPEPPPPVPTRPRITVPAAPDVAQPTTTQATRIWRDALRARGLRVVVATEARALWLMRDTAVLMSAPIAVGTDKPFEYEGKRYDFTTPIGRRRVLAKDTMPLWVPPDWHYFELASERQLELVRFTKGMRLQLADSTWIEMRGNDVGRINQFGNFWPFTPGSEIIFDNKIIMPPLGSRQRQIPEVLGTHKLVLGDGYLIHGTNSEYSIGEAVSHGCVRMYNEDVAKLYALVPVGTAVYIF